MITVRLVKDSDLPELRRLATLDNHSVLAPTHVVEKAGLLVGYLSIGAIPTVIAWLDTQQVKVRDTIQVKNVYEDLLKTLGAQFVLLPIGVESPCHDYPEKAGYVNAGTMTMFIKQLTGGGQ